MKKAIVYSSATRNTEKLALAIKENLDEVIYFGKVSEEALNADEIYLGSWTQAFTCTKDIADFAKKLENKRVFLFMTAGYGNTEEFFAPIINSFIDNIGATNTIIGQFICQGKVSEGKQEAIKKLDINKYHSLKEKLDESLSHPNNVDIEELIKLVK